ncbi:LLM class flavin-dependent oxidoreductase [Desertihabitans brevis]|uniref:LLM class flavin-dependent oxidoreductase n=1 Tax=Desertihabitans brevis TaxID=2268447 RepID=A0A367YQ29_9ACTN|nr:LLM class flavin-dependent oxidoreductase [Desertihabitans brevis]RCK67944.1 LLM class flavin-dependent oxidoreductase [Desertihabitans brevis]
MPDYGLELQFGLFPTPSAASPETVVELGVLADVSGLDLVSVQDHPYQAAHLDSWTLLSFLAARTTSVRLAPNVANLPLRPPVVLARSVATLDLLSTGRAELGLGAGAFWDAVVAAGGPRRSPREAVDALVEAIEVVRAVWRGQGSVRVDGEHYRVRGLRSGPAPAHPVPIWVGAYGPRMLAVTGRLGDAWIPSMAYAGPERLPEMNARIDEAAVAAGRAPEDVRRLYNVSGRFDRARTSAADGLLQGTPSEWAEQLAELALEEGMSGFVLATDDPDDVRRFATEVTPAVRDLVAAERELRSSRGGRPVAAGLAGSALRQARGGTTEDAGGTSADERDQAEAGTRVQRAEPVEARAAADGTGPLTVRPTPDDGTRLSGGPDWDEASRPRYGGPRATRYTPAQQAQPQHLIDVHDHLRAELAQVRDVVRQVAEGHTQVGAARSVINTMTMRQNNWTLGAYCESYCRVVTGHHSLEDRSVFPRLRALDPDAAPVLDRLEAEHVTIHDLLDGLDRALVGLVGQERPGDPALAELQRSVDLLTDAMLSHLSYEERELLHPLARFGLA